MGQDPNPNSPPDLLSPYAAAPIGAPLAEFPCFIGGFGSTKQGDLYLTIIVPMEAKYEAVRLTDRPGLMINMIAMVPDFSANIPEVTPATVSPISGRNLNSPHYKQWAMYDGPLVKSKDCVMNVWGLVRKGNRCPKNQA